MSYKPSPSKASARVPVARCQPHNSPVKLHEVLATDMKAPSLPVLSALLSTDLSWEHYVLLAGTMVKSQEA